MRPPHHRITPTLRIIDKEDPAWDSDRFKAEILPLEGDELDDHPIYAYLQGSTHFDLDAVGYLYDAKGQPIATSPRSYLKGTPRVFEARRLTIGEVTTCLDRGDRTGSLWAFQLAVKRIDGFAFDQAHGKALSDGQVQSVVDALGSDVVLRIGVMVLRASRAPTPAEGKSSGSSGGPRLPAPGVSPADGSRGIASATVDAPMASGTTASELDGVAPA